ncbi:MAG: sigma-54-dependent transcriptional regulator [Phycisphaerales bacterium]
MAKIVIIEDEENLRFSIRKSLARAKHEVSESDSVTTALEIIERDEPDLVLTDINLGGESGLDLVKKLREDGFAGVILVMTAYGSVENAVEAMKLGADEYLQKPVSLEELRVLVERTLENRRVRSRLDLYERLERSRQREHDLIGESETWRSTLDLAQRMAALPVGSGETISAILLLGETGSGKGRLARYIHDESDQREAPFVHVNCSALPATLIESELFGHEKGAFTDARSSRQGLFELADGGTIFLDEIGDMPVELQSKLLLVVEQGVFRRLGGTKERRVNARVIAATNQNLEELADRGQFRRDLFYRLNALTLRIPPLCERGDDAVLLAEDVLENIAQKVRRPTLKFSGEAKESIRMHSWPGNVRELINAVQRAALLTNEDEITPGSLGLSDAATSGKARPMRREAAAPTRPDELQFDFSNGAFNADEVEKELIVQALRHARGNVSKASKLIGMNRSSLRYRIERYSLDELVQELVNQ